MSLGKQKSKKSFTIKDRWPSLLLVLLLTLLAITIAAANSPDPEADLLKELQTKEWRLLDRSPCPREATRNPGFYSAADQDHLLEFFFDSQGRAWSYQERDLNAPICRAIKKPSFVEELTDEK